MTTTNCLPFQKPKYDGPYLALNFDCTRLASVDRLNHCVYIYNLDSSGECTNESVVFGISGSAGCSNEQMRRPQSPCFVHRGGVETLLLCDWGNDRVVELTVGGEFMRAIPFPFPYCVAYNRNRDVIAVSLWSNNEVIVLEYERAAEEPLYVMEVFSCPTGMVFTADGEHLLVADFGNHRLSKFRVDDGALVAHLASRSHGGLWCPRDVIQRDDGTIVVAHFNGLTIIGLDGKTEIVFLSYKPLSLLYSPFFGVIVCNTDAMSFVLKDTWLSSSRYAWLAVTTCTEM